MTLKKSIQEELNKLDEAELEELYHVILDFIQQRHQSGEGNLLTNLAKIKISGPEDFADNHDLYMSGLEND